MVLAMKLAGHLGNLNEQYRQTVIILPSLGSSDFHTLHSLIEDYILLIRKFSYVNESQNNLRWPFFVVQIASLQLSLLTNIGLNVLGKELRGYFYIYMPLISIGLCVKLNDSS